MGPPAMPQILMIVFTQSPGDHSMKYCLRHGYRCVFCVVLRR